MALACVLIVLTLLAGINCMNLSGIHVQGNQFVNKAGQTVTLRGMDHSGSEYACVQGWGIFDGPSNQSLIDNFKAWNGNAVRLPLNEDCWLGINGIKTEYSGTNYQKAIHNLAQLFTDAGMVVILDLHWTAPGSTKATGQQPMPNVDHSIDFWKSVAMSFKDYDKIFFELFNEPYPDGGQWDSSEGWRCWKEGGSCSQVNFQAAGMQTLVNAVRSTGAENVILLGGLAWSNSLNQWLEYKPTDPKNNTGASWHSYNFNYCSNQECWDSSVGKVKERYPVVTTEFGENDCAGGYVTPLMQWMDSKQLSYLAWTFNSWDCKSGPALIKDYNNGGTPTNYGVAVKNHYSSTNN